MKTKEDKLKFLFNISWQFIILVIALILLEKFKIFIVSNYAPIPVLSFLASGLFVISSYYRFEQTKKYKTIAASIFAILNITIITFVLTGLNNSSRELFLLTAFLSMFTFIAFSLSFSTAEMKTNVPRYIIPILLALFLGAYIIHIDTIKYFDSDEVRLFFDAKQISEGKTAFVDFNARAPALIYPLTVFVSAFGSSYMVFYYLSAILNVLGLYLLYIFAKRIFNEKIAIYSMIIFGLAPIMTFLLWFKTQTVLIPVMLASLILFDKYLTDKKKMFAYLSFALFFYAFFIRETTVVYILGHVSLVLFREKNWENIKKHGHVLFNLFFISIVLYVIINSIFFTYGGFTLKNDIMNFFDFEIDESSQSRFQHAGDYFSYYYFLLYAASLIIPSIALFKVISKFKNYDRKMMGYLVPQAVLAGLVAIYVFNTYRLGFWPQYFMEFMPYIAISAAVMIYHFEKNLPSKKIIKITAIASILAIILISNFYGIVGMKMYKGAINREGAVMLSEELKKISDENDIIFAGSPIYAFITDREHFMNLSHDYYHEGYVMEVTNNIKSNPPEFIVKDGRVRSYYLKNTGFKEFFDANYIEISSFNKTDYNRTWEAGIYKLNSTKHNVIVS